MITPTDEPLPEKRVRPARIDSTELMKGARELLIIHNGELYRLQITRNNKLILKK